MEKAAGLSEDCAGKIYSGPLKREEQTMKIYDLSQEVFSSRVFPGDPSPRRRPVSSMEEGKACNLTEVTMGTHNSTHMDAPRHFYKDGRTIDQLDLQKCVGPCKVIAHSGKLLPETV